MKPLNIFQRLMNWLSERGINCEKGRHRWGYTLSESGIVYTDDSKVPPELWHCLECGEKKATTDLQDRKVGDLIIDGKGKTWIIARRWEHPTFWDYKLVNRHDGLEEGDLRVYKK